MEVAIKPAATIVISTHNRRQELARTLDAAFSQEGPIEVLVIDDGSEDGTSALVEERYPGVRLVRSEQSQGYIRQRNHGAELARAPIVVSIDDDAVFSAPTIVADTLSRFDHERVGGVAIPHINVRQGPQVLTRAPEATGLWVTSSYIGTAHAVRRDVFLALGGYRDELIHQTEEADFCLRMLGSGYITRLGWSEPILHYESTQRNVDRMLFYSRRNDILHGWHNVPMPYLPLRLAKVTVHSAALAVGTRRPRPIVQGLAAGYRDAIRRRRQRTPVARSVYRLEHELRKHGSRRLEEIEQLLPAPARFDHVSMSTSGH